MSAAQFVSQPLQPDRAAFEPYIASQGEPYLPAGFLWNDQRLEIRDVVRAWRSVKTDRGDDYLARFWYEVTLKDSSVAVIYFDRKAKPKAPRWWLYSISGIGHR